MATAATVSATKLDGVVYAPPTRQRIDSIDLLRGLVMVIMMLDHTRDYFSAAGYQFDPTNLTKTSVALFLTRWITHFCAPTFFFLAGTGAYLHGRKFGNAAALSRFLLTRGVWLIVLELTVIRVAWTFNLDFAHYLLAGVIWMIGWCMILLAAAAYLPTRVVAVIGIAIIALHNVTDLFAGQLERVFGDAGPGWLLQILYFDGVVKFGSSGPPLFVLFVIVPWIGVMMAGYAFGRVVEMAPEQRQRICIRLGVALVMLFVVLRIAGVYGDPRSWSAAASRMPAYLAFLATSKSRRRSSFSR
jgi:Predicted membrane protein